MAKGFTPMKWRRKGYQEAMNARKCQKILRKHAGYMQGGANARLGENVYYTAPVQGRLARGYVVGVPMPSGNHREGERVRREQILRDQA